MAFFKTNISIVINVDEQKLHITNVNFKLCNYYKIIYCSRSLPHAIFYFKDNMNMLKRCYMETYNMLLYRIGKFLMFQVPNLQCNVYTVALN